MGSRVCVIYSPGEEVAELGRTGIERRKLTEYEVWVGDCIEPGVHILSSSSRQHANRIGIGLALSMRIRLLGASV